MVFVVADHVRLVVPLTERVVPIEVDEHDLEHGAVDKAVDDTGQDVTAEHGSRGQLGIVCIFEVGRETTSHLLEGAAEHEDDQLREGTAGPPDTRKHLPDDVQRDAGCRDRFDDDPRNGQQGADCGDGEDRPPRCLRRPRCDGDD